MSFDAHPRSSLIVALDFDSLSSAVKFAEKIADLVGMFKIGKQLFTAAGPEVVRQVAALGPGVFLDLKYHDIPNTVAGAVLSAAAINGVQLVNIHALGGSAMMAAAVQAVNAVTAMGEDRPRLLAVTILTSMDQKAMREVGITGIPKDRVLKLAKLAKKARRRWGGGFGAGSTSHPEGLRAGFSDCYAGRASGGRYRRRQEGFHQEE